jgi:hypothetical protein
LPDGDTGFLIADSGEPVSILCDSVELAENVKAP